VARAQVAFQPQSHGAIGSENHGHSLGRSLSAQDGYDSRVEKLNAGLFPISMFFGARHGLPAKDQKQHHHYIE